MMAWLYEQVKGLPLEPCLCGNAKIMLARHAPVFTRAECVGCGIHGKSHKSRTEVHQGIHKDTVSKICDEWNDYIRQLKLSTRNE